MNTKIKISFDIDGTLKYNDDQFIWLDKRFVPNPNICEELTKYALELGKNELLELHIITRRFGTEKQSYDEVMEIADRLSIPRVRVHFLNHAYKYQKINELGIHIHIDDDVLADIFFINNHTDCYSVFVGDVNWKNNFNALITKLSIS